MIALGQRTKNIEMASEFIANSRSLEELSLCPSGKDGCAREAFEYC
jgi:hypothetical protein